MSKQMITIHNAETGEVIEREMTIDEIAFLTETNAPKELTAEELAAQAARSAAEAKLATLGLTADDLKALGL